MSVQYYTYFYFDPKDGTPIYVGKGHAYRAKDHLYTNNNPRLYNTLQKRKQEGFNPYPIVWNMPTEAEALQLEIFWIAYYGRADKKSGTLFNLTDGGDSPPKRSTPHSPETREKIKAANTRNPKLCGKTPWNKGLELGPQSQELIEKRRKSMIGHTISEETKRKISAAQKGKPRPNCTKGIPRSEEVKQKIRDTKARRKNAEKEANTESQTT